MENERKFKSLGGFNKSFKWFIEKLLPPTDNIKGCEIIMPDSAFFNTSGVPELVVKNDKD